MADMVGFGIDQETIKEIPRGVKLWLEPPRRSRENGLSEREPQALRRDR